MKLSLPLMFLALTACSGASEGLPPLDVGTLDTGPPAENTFARCQDGEDNDGDGQTDCSDDQCAIFIICGGEAGPPDAAGDDAGRTDASLDGPAEASSADAAPADDAAPAAD
jgi:hypothetical protein